MTEKFMQIEEILGQTEGRILLLDHEFSDPDGFGSKYAWAYIAREKFKLDADIGYSKEIGNNTTQALMEKFRSFYHTEMKKIEDINLDDYALILLLDVNLNSGNLPFTEEQRGRIDYNRIIVIDHHGVERIKEHKAAKRLARFEDITEDGSIGSACTRTIEYLKYFGLKFSQDVPEHNLLATALWIGMETDLIGRRPTARDLKSLAHVIESASKQVKDEIDRRPRPEQAQRAFGHALETYNQIGPYAIATLGAIEPTNKDIMAITAGELLKAQGIEASIAWAIVGEEAAIGSIRTKEESPLSAKKIADLYNDKVMFNGGGRPNAAGFTGQLRNIVPDYQNVDVSKLIGILHDIIMGK
ncbi:MAG: DHHA1 domain-containing protein [Nanoarchaeota archaeon]